MNDITGRVAEEEKITGISSGTEQINVSVNVGTDESIIRQVVTELTANKVDKEAGKVLSSNDYTDTEKAKLASLSNYDDTSIRIDLSKKVEKIEGKGLSSNDFTDKEKHKLEELENYNDAEVRGLIGNKQDKLTAGENITIVGNVISATGGSSYDDTEIRRELGNKVEKVDGKELSSNDFTNAEKAKLESLENYDDTQVKADIQTINNKLDGLEELLSEV